MKNEHNFLENGIVSKQKTNAKYNVKTKNKISSTKNQKLREIDRRKQIWKKENQILNPFYNSWKFSKNPAGRLS